MSKKIIIIIIIIVIIILSSIGFYWYNQRKKISYTLSSTYNTPYPKKKFKYSEHVVTTHDINDVKENNYTNQSNSKKKVKFVETNDFIYYDPKEPPKNLRK